jgi:hypothetical protein
METRICPKCGGPLIQKNKTKLFLAGIGFFIVGAGLLWLSYKCWPLAFFLFLISVYMIVWSLFGKGLWCRQCKFTPLKGL